MMRAGWKIDRGLIVLLLSLAATVAAIVGYHLVRPRPAPVAIAVFDITGSMNTRDMGNPHGSESRLEAARNAVIKLMEEIPCQSKLGLGVFTERISFLLFDPVEVCRNYDALQGAISGLDWRMAWEGDSYIAKGLYSAVEISRSLGADVIFLTDGQEAPPLPFTGVPDFDGKPGEVKGLIVGVGGSDKVPIPKYDDDGRQVGVYNPTDVPQDNRIGAAPPDAEAREGYNPRNAPFGAMPAVGDEHLTSVKTAYLQDLALRTGLSYVELQNTNSLAKPLMEAARARVVPTDIDAGYLAALLALLLLVSLYVVALLAAIRRADARFFVRLWT